MGLDGTGRSVTERIRRSRILAAERGFEGGDAAEKRGHNGLGPRLGLLVELKLFLVFALVGRQWWVVEEGFVRWVEIGRVAVGLRRRRGVVEEWVWCRRGTAGGIVAVTTGGGDWWWVVAVVVVGGHWRWVRFPG